MEQALRAQAASMPGGQGADPGNHYDEWKRRPVPEQPARRPSQSRQGQEATSMQPQPLQPREQLSEGQRLAGLGYGRAGSLSRQELDGEALKQKHQAKDFSRDPQRLEWGDPSNGQFSRAALLAQGHQLPPLPRPRV